MSRELHHHTIKARIFDYSDQIWQDVIFFLDEVEEDLYEAETRMMLFVNPSDILTDIATAMDQNHIYGRLYHQVDYDVFNQKLPLSI